MATPTTRPPGSAHHDRHHLRVHRSTASLLLLMAAIGVRGAHAQDAGARRHRTPSPRRRRAGAEHDLVRVEARRSHLVPGEHVGRRRAGAVEGRRGLPARQDLGLRPGQRLGVGRLQRRVRHRRGGRSGTDQAEGPVARPERRLPARRRREGADLLPALQLRRGTSISGTSTRPTSTRSATRRPSSGARTSSCRSSSRRSRAGSSPRRSATTSMSGRRTRRRATRRRSSAPAT